MRFEWNGFTAAEIETKYESICECVCVWLANAISIMNTESEWHSEEGKSIKIENAIQNHR